ncbi:MAG: hypothetical protein MZU84_08750 [Sphingobacterium sp.]|nr:hypothetical protein [Sphingobacterium sp.]
MVQISDNLTTSSPVSAQNHRSHSPHSMSRPGRLGPRPEAVSPTRLMLGIPAEGTTAVHRVLLSSRQGKGLPYLPQGGTSPPAIGSRRRSPRPGRP